MNPVDRSLYERILRQDLSMFVHRTFLSLCPTAPYLHNWHVDALSWCLEQVEAGSINRLLISLPPRSLKSICASVAFPAWLLGRHPESQIVCASYSGELSSKLALDCRSIMNTAWYRQTFPGTRIGKLRDQESDFVTTKRGGRYATSVGGTLTGRGGNVIIIDDPLKPEDAMSEPRRATVNDWFKRTLYSRLNDKQRDAIIVIMQRLHDDDLVGHLLSEGQEPWVQLVLPAISPRDQRIPIGPEEFYTWQTGEPLHARRESLATLEQIRSAMGTYNFSAQYLQEPVPIDGDLLRWEWFPRYTELPKKKVKEGDEIIQSWDTASKPSEMSDFSVCSTWLQKANGDHYLIDVYRERLKYPDLRRAAYELAARHEADCIVIEDRGSGTALIQDLCDDYPPTVRDICEFAPDTDKVSRAVAVSALIEGGHVHLPAEAPWLEALRREMVQFPGGKYDDQVDSLTQYLNWAEDNRRNRPQILGWI